MKRKLLLYAKDFPSRPAAPAILREPQFPKRDVLEVTGLTEAQLKNTVDRDLVRLQEDHNPGSGRRRLYSGSDILKLTVAQTMSGIGFPMKWQYLVADEIVRRAEHRLSGFPDAMPGFAMITYPRPDGDWERIGIFNGGPEHKLPPVYQVLEVDRLIDEVLSKINAIIAETAIPDVDSGRYSKPKPSPWSPENDFFRKWDKDSQGRDVYVGLTYEETVEAQCYEADFIAGKDRHANKSRHIELDERHEKARLARLGADFADKQTEGE